MAERYVRNVEVGGSSPLTSTTKALVARFVSCTSVLSFVRQNPSAVATQSTTGLTDTHRLQPPGGRLYVNGSPCPPNINEQRAQNVAGILACGETRKTRKGLCPTN